MTARPRPTDQVLLGFDGSRADDVAAFAVAHLDLELDEWQVAFLTAIYDGPRSPDVVHVITELGAGDEPGRTVDARLGRFGPRAGEGGQVLDDWLWDRARAGGR